MKNTLTLFFTIIGLTLFAQQEAPPQGINYQAVIYSDNGNSQPGINSPGQVLWNEDLTMRFSIYLGATNPTMVYQELHLTSTDEFGLVSLVIGQGTPQGTQLFESIDWGAGEHFLQVEIDKEAGLNFQVMSYQKLWSVPYALYSGYAGSSGYADSSSYADIAGNGITDVIDNGDGTLTFNFYDGSTYTTDILSGLEGPMGPAGADGLSAYEIWLSLGNTGTEQDFLNGLTGPAGNDGVDGVDGVSAYEVWLSLGNTGTEQDFLNGLTGPQGPAGATGPQGPQGDPGSFPNGTNNGDMLYWDGTNWTIVNGASSNNQILTWCDGIPTWTPDGNCPGTAQGTINTLDCASATTTGTLTEGQAASGVSVSVPYTGGDGGTHNGQTVSSNGVTGLTATLMSGTFANGNGTLSYTISGTPSTSGSASFALNIGGQTCILTMNVQAGSGSQYPSGTVFCASGPTEIVEVTNPVTGKTWMDRNLGASQVAVESTDANSYGDLYQWGRKSDGHQCRNSNTTTGWSNSDQPNHGDFYIDIGAPYDWRSPQNNNLWQGLNGINNPCPNGFRVPTASELDQERNSWVNNDNLGAFNSPLKLSIAGLRHYNGGNLSSIGTQGRYWSSTISNTDALNLVFGPGYANVGPHNRALGFSIRCIKD